MPVQAFLGRSHIGRGDNQGHVGARRRSEAGLLDGLARRLHSAAGQQWHAIGDFAPRHFDQRREFRRIQRRALARGSGNDKATRARADLESDEAAKRVQVKRIVAGAERRRECADATGEFQGQGDVHVRELRMLGGTASEVHCHQDGVGRLLATLPGRRYPARTVAPTAAAAPIIP